MNESQTKPIILLVDDDPDYLFQQRTVLEGAGYEVVAADGRGQAEEILRSVRPDLAILDLMMEEMDGGFTLCHRIKQVDPAIPVILITGVTRETGLEFDATTGEERSWIKADAILSKPTRFEQLKREIDRLMRRASKV